MPPPLRRLRQGFLEHPYLGGTRSAAGEFQLNPAQGDYDRGRHLHAFARETDLAPAEWISRSAKRAIEYTP
jgi:hypothetical protein